MRKKIRIIKTLGHKLNSLNGTRALLLNNLRPYEIHKRILQEINLPFSKSKFKIRSASSSTKNLILFKLKLFVVSKCSTKRPGVAIRMCGLRLSACSCGPLSNPPTIATDSTPRLSPNA